MAIAQVVAGARILISDLNAYYSLLKGSAGETITLIYNAAGSVIFQPSSDPAATTQLVQIKNNAGTVRSALTSGGGLVLSNPALFAQSSDIASSGTTDLSAATGNYVVITGTTTITAFGTVQAGTVMVLKFSGILTLTHNATSLILRSGANATTAAGDVYVFASEGSGNWREISHLTATVATADSDPTLETGYWRTTYSGEYAPSETTVTSTGTVAAVGAVATRRLDTGATSGSTAGIRTALRATTASWAVGKVRRLEIQGDFITIDANTTSYLLLTAEYVTGAPSLTSDHIGIKNVAGAVSFTTADGTTEQTTSITANVVASQDQTFTVTFDGTTAKLYIDGTLRATHATNVPRSTLNGQVVLRAYITNSSAASKKLDLTRFDALFAT